MEHKRWWRGLLIFSGDGRCFDDLRPLVAATNSFLVGTDEEAVIESPAVSDGVIRDARCNLSLDRGWVLVHSGATDESAS